MSDPIQSKIFTSSRMGPTLWSRRRQMGMATRVMPQKGMLSQNIQRQVVSSTMAPPRIGPMTEPIAHWRLIIPNHFPRSCSDTISVVITYVNATIPPPPIPCIQRPTSKPVMSVVVAAIAEPTVKNISAAISTGFRPRICEKNAQGGCRTVLARRYDVAAQNAWREVPWSFEVIAYVSDLVFLSNVKNLSYWQSHGKNRRINCTNKVHKTKTSKGCIKSPFHSCRRSSTVILFIKRRIMYG
jgi:hypothetical protein